MAFRGAWELSELDGAIDTLRIASEWPLESPLLRLYVRRACSRISAGLLAATGRWEPHHGVGMLAGAAEWAVCEICEMLECEPVAHAGPVAELLHEVVEALQAVASF